jgi:transposase InsO family protein
MATAPRYPGQWVRDLVPGDGGCNRCLSREPGGRKRVARLMRERGINVKPKRRKVKTTDSNHRNPVAPNLLKRDFTADAPNTKWVADIPGVGTAEGWLSGAAIVDSSSRLAVGWAMGQERDEQLITRATKMALTGRRPGAGLIHHSEKGRGVVESGVSRTAQRSRNTSEPE